MSPQKQGPSLLRALGASAVLCAAFLSAAPGDVITITHPHWDPNEADVTLPMDFRFVGDLGNAPDDTTGYGRVDHNYRIGTYAVSVDQWNIVSDAIEGGLGRSTAGHSSHRSEAKEPVNAITWYQAAEFANWLTSGDKNVGAYDTRSAVNWGDEDASRYTGVTARNSPEMSALLATYDTVYVLPTENEWYKAAYYDPNRYGSGDSGYWLYPTRQTDAAPTAIDPGGGTEEYTAVFGRGSWGGGGLPDDHDMAGGLSAYGTMGQGGNMGEWTESIHTTSTENRVRRSSSFSPGVTHLLSTSRSSWHPHRTNSHIGLRVAMLQYQATQWTGGTDDSWQTVADWTDGVPAAGDLVVFNSSGIYPGDAATPLTLDGTVDVYGIMVGDGADHLGQVDFGVTDRILASGGLLRLGAGGLTASMLNTDASLPDEARFVSIRSDIELTADTFIRRIGNFGQGARNRTLIIDGVISGGTPDDPVHLVVDNDGAGSPNRAVRFTSSNTFVGEMDLSGTVIMNRGDGFGDPSNPVRFGNSMYLLMSAPDSATTANPINLSTTSNVLINRSTGSDWTLTGDITGGAGNRTMSFLSGRRRIIFAGSEQSFENRVDLWTRTRVVIAAADENGVAWPNAGRIRLNSNAAGGNDMGHLLLQGDFTLNQPIEVRNVGGDDRRQARLGQLNDGATPFDAVFNGSIDVQETSFRALQLTADAGGSATFTGPIRVAGGYGFVKLGAGTVAVNNRVSQEFGTLDPIGQVVVEEGTLLVNSPEADPFATSEILVSPGAVLGGAGHVAGDVTLDGTSANPATLTPGNSPGTLEVSGDVALGAGPAGSTGTVHLTGGSLAVGGSVTGGAGLRTVHVDQGTMTVAGNLVVDALRVGHQEGTAALSAGGVVEIGSAASRPDLLIANTTLAGASGDLKTVAGTLDLSGASQFTAYLGELVVGRATRAHARATGTLKLAETNHIDAESITIADIGHYQGGGGTSSMVLGQTNTFVTDLLTVGGARGRGSLAFADGMTGGTLTLTNPSGGKVDLHIAYTDANTTTPGDGTMDLSGGTFTATTLGEVVIGYRLARSSTHHDPGLLVFAGGDVTADSLLLGSVGWDSNFNQTGQPGRPNEAYVTGELDMRGGSFEIVGDVVAGVGRADAGNPVRTHMNHAHGQGTIRLSAGTFSATGSMTLGIGEEDPTEDDRVARGTGTLEISGGTAEIGGNITLATGHEESVGTIDLSGGTLAAGSVTKGDKGTAVFDFTGGTLHVGTFGAPGAAFDLEQKGGTLAPGTSIGTTTIYGDYLQSAGTLQIDIAGPDEHDFVMVYGNAMLEGSLDVLLDGFAPSVGHSFDVLQTTGDLTVDFADVSIGPADLVFGWWEVAAVPYPGGDGHLLRLSAVPEPTTAMLTLLALAGLLGCVRPRRRGSPGTSGGVKV